MKVRLLCVGLCAILLLWTACEGDPPDQGQDAAAEITRVQTDRTYLRDAEGRFLMIHGINVSGSSKHPPTEVFPRTDEDVSYVGTPFPLDEADQWFGQLRDLGFNAIRLILMWEGVEPNERGVYDTEYLDYIEDIIIKAEEYGIYVLLDFHQDMFSRHLYTLFNENLPEGIDPGSIEGQLLSMLPDEDDNFTNWLRGDGAPRWAVEACLYEKEMDSPNWGKSRLLGGLTADTITTVARVYQALVPGDSVEIPDWVDHFVLYAARHTPFGVEETSDVLPFTTWGINHALSSDVERMYVCMTAGRAVYPNLEVDGLNIQDYLQDAYANAFAQVAERARGHENVIGYDLMNEPSGWFLMMTVLATFFETGAMDGLEELVQGLVGEELGADVWSLITGLNLLPPDNEPETRYNWGYEGIDLMGVIGLNIGYGRNHQQPFYEHVGQAIQEVDPDAIIWIETPHGLEIVLGGSTGYGQMEQFMTRLEGIDQLVYAPHWYPDIYPMPGLLQPPREFTDEEIRYRDYTEKLDETRWRSDYSLGNIPVVYGEFGAYYNFNGIEESIANDYLVSAHILDNYYEGFENLLMGHMQWCFSAENSYDDGEGWNKEDFSIVDPAGVPRGELAFSRPYARALAGEPISTHFYSDYHYYDPDKGEVDPLREFEVTYESRETTAPTVIYTAESVQYPRGFYVWLSDGYAYYDRARQLLYHYPTADDPEAVHWVRLRPPLEGLVQEDWDYFIQDERVVDGPARGR